MSPERFRVLLGQLGWSQGEVARLLKRNAREIHRWYSGKIEIEADVAAWLEMQAANPPPKRRGPDLEGFSR
jgi:plasmid maintenance system antidote protein VapI